MDLLLITIFSVITFFTRIINLLKIPIFTDEAIYIRWAQIGLADPAHRYLSLEDGKQPLFTWLMYPFLMLFNDPLLAGRFVSVLAGIFSVIGIYLLAKTLFNRQTAVISCLLYIIAPFALVYDKLALMDSLLATFGIWSLYLQVLQAKYIRFDIALIMGIVIGLGFLTKSSALFYLALIPFSMFVFNFKEKNVLKSFLKWAGYSFLSIVIAQIIYNSLRLSPLFYIIEQKNYSFIYTFSEFFNNPLAFIIPNLNGLSGFLIGYLTIPITIAVILNLIIGLFQKNHKIYLLFFWFFVPFLSLAAFGKVLFPRFILFMTLPLLVIAGNFLFSLYNFARLKMKIFYLVFFLFIINPLTTAFVLVSDPVKADIPKNDRNQLFDDWPSGFGVREVVGFIEKQARNNIVVLGTEGTFGLNPAVYDIYLKNNKNVIIRGFWPISEIPNELIEYAKVYPTYLVFKDRQEFPANWPLQLIFKYRRGLGNTYLYFFRVIPENVTPKK